MSSYMGVMDTNAISSFHPIHRGAVCEGREKLTEKISMGSVDLNGIEPCFSGSSCSISKRRNNLPDFVHRHGAVLSFAIWILLKKWWTYWEAISRVGKPCLSSCMDNWRAIFASRLCTAAVTLLNPFINSSPAIEFWNVIICPVGWT